MLAHMAVVVAAVVQEPLPGGVGIGHGLPGGEGLGGNDEQGGFWIELDQGFVDIRAVHVGYEMCRQSALPIWAQGGGHHVGSQVGTPDTDIDDVGNSRACIASPAAIMHSAAKGLHSSQHPLYVRNHIPAIHGDFGIGRRTQGGMQHGPVFRIVDAFPSEHALDP